MNSVNSPQQLEIKPPNRTPGSFNRFLVSAFKVCTIAYITILILMVAGEAWLVYPAPVVSDQHWSSQLKKTAAEEVYFQAADGNRICGWWYEHSDPQHVGIFFHGNGEDVCRCSDFVSQMSSRFEMSILAFDYRGYGKSQGTPNEAGICQDADAALNWIVDRTERQPNEVLLIGRSLGGGVAMHLAENSNSKAIVLLSTFSSMPDIAAPKYPILPVRWLMRNQYCSVEKIKSCRQPLLQFHGRDDQMIPLELGRKLFNASPADNKTFVELPAAGHNYYPPEIFWRSTRAFLKNL